MYTPGLLTKDELSQRDDFDSVWVVYYPSGNIYRFFVQTALKGQTAYGLGVFAFDNYWLAHGLSLRIRAERHYEDKD